MNLMSKSLVVFIIVFVIGCKSSTEPIEAIKKEPFMSLTIGDIRQYQDDTGGLYFQIEVIDTIRRSDGVVVFEIEETMLFINSNELYRGKNYYFIDNEYFISTQLDSNDNKTNPFSELRIAKIYPEDGDYFQTNLGAEDSLKTFLLVQMIDSLNTYAKTFENIAEYIDIGIDSSSDNRIYYSKNIGHIGTLINNELGKSSILAIYCKVDTFEIGNYIPFNSNNKFLKLDKKIIPYLF